MGARALMFPHGSAKGAGDILPDTLSREEELLLLLCRRELAEPQRERALRLAPQADWRRVLTLICAGRVFPLARRSLESLGWPHVPAEIVTEIERTWAQVVRWSVHLTGELLRHVDLLAGQGVRAIPYKGPLLATELYGDVTMRQYSDLDLIVRPQDVARAKRALLGLDYRPEYDFTPREEEAHLRACCEYNFDSPDRRLHVELHWRLLPCYFPFSPAPERLWVGEARTTVAGRELPTLPPETLALALSLHGYKHMWERLGLVCDIAALASLGRVDWRRVLETAGQLGAGRAVRIALALAVGLLGAEVPPDCYHPGADAEADRLAAHCARRILAGEEQPPPDFELYRFYWQGMAGGRDRARFLSRWFLCSTTKQGALQYPRGARLPWQVVTRTSTLSYRLARRVWRTFL